MADKKVTAFEIVCGGTEYECKFLLLENYRKLQFIHVIIYITILLLLLWNIYILTGSNIWITYVQINML